MKKNQEKKPFTVLHTSDWHLGKQLKDHKRYDEYILFLSWLENQIREHYIDALLIAGDIFDTITPPTYAQELYYSFLGRLLTTTCKQIVITGGNHDSATFLNAPKSVLKFLNVTVIGGMPENYEDEIVILKDTEGKPAAIVYAVPYLREGDVRKPQPDDTPEKRELRLAEGIRSHYKEVLAIAQLKQEDFGNNVPIIAMGHLFTRGGRAVDGDGVRQLYVGSLQGLDPVIFGTIPDYVALGHLHIAQDVKADIPVRYSGSPIRMSFDEGEKEKSVTMVSFQGKECLSVQKLPVPEFRTLMSIRGTQKEILNKLQEVADNPPEQSEYRVSAKTDPDSPFQGSIWVQIILTEEQHPAALREEISRTVNTPEISVLQILLERKPGTISYDLDESEELNTLDEMKVFDMLLAAKNIDPKDQDILRELYKEIVDAIHLGDDSNKE